MKISENDEALLLGFLRFLVMLILVQGLCSKNGYIQRTLSLGIGSPETAATFGWDGWVRAICCGSDGCDTVLGAFVALVGGFDVPDVGFEGVAAAANAHFCKVADGILGFGEACGKKG